MQYKSVSHRHTHTENFVSANMPLCVKGLLQSWGWGLSMVARYSSKRNN
jgi:hypothetical protein